MRWYILSYISIIILQGSHDSVRYNTHNEGQKWYGPIGSTVQLVIKLIKVTYMNTRSSLTLSRHSLPWYYGVGLSCYPLTLDGHGQPFTLSTTRRAGHAKLLYHFALTINTHTTHTHNIYNTHTTHDAISSDHILEKSKLKFSLFAKIIVQGREQGHTPSISAGKFILCTMLLVLHVVSAGPMREDERIIAAPYLAYSPTPPFTYPPISDPSQGLLAIPNLIRPQLCRITQLPQTLTMTAT